MTSKLSCFIAMPIAVHDNEAELYGDDEHWAHVMTHLFIPAIKAAGYEPIVPSASGTSMIHGRIVKHLVEADMVLCDLSRHNPNVLFELGVRTALNRPVALLKDEHLKLPFDIQGLNTHHYSSSLNPWTLSEQISAISQHISDTAEASGLENPLWAHFGVSISASQPPSAESPEEAKLQLILETVRELATPAPRSSFVRRDDFDTELHRALGKQLASLPGVNGVSVSETGEGISDINITTEPSSSDRQHSRAVKALKIVAELTRDRVRLVGTSPTGIELTIEPGGGTAD